MRYKGDLILGPKVATTVRTYGLTNSQLLQQCIEIWQNGFRPDIAGSGSSWDTTEEGAHD
jgi:hypothetical protein